MPITRFKGDEILSKPEESFTFYYKKTDAGQKQLQKVLDPELRARAVEKLKSNIGNLKYVVLNQYNCVFGFRNLFDYSVERDKQKVLDYLDMIQIIPLDFDSKSNSMNEELLKYDGILLPGALWGEESFPYQPLGLDEYLQHYEPDGQPKTYPRHRTPSNIFRLYQDIYAELININSAGTFLPTWCNCYGASILPLVAGSPELS